MVISGPWIYLQLVAPRLKALWIMIGSTIVVSCIAVRGPDTSLS